MTNSSNSDLTPEQVEVIENAYACWLRREHAINVLMQAEERWTEAFKSIWDNNDGDGAMWAEFERLRKRKGL